MERRAGEGKERERRRGLVWDYITFYFTRSLLSTTSTEKLCKHIIICCSRDNTIDTC